MKQFQTVLPSPALPARYDVGNHQSENLVQGRQSETTFVEILTHNVGQKYRIAAASAVTAQQW